MISRLFRMSGLVFSAAALFVIPASCAQSQIEMETGPGGVSALKRAGTNLLGNGRPEVSNIVLESRSLNSEGFYDYSFERIDGDKAETRFDEKEGVLTCVYKWGSIAFRYETKTDQVDVAVTIDNRSESTVAMFEITALTLSLPRPIETPKRWKRRVTLPGDFNAVEAVCGDTKLIWGCETVMPLTFGFGKPADGKKTLPLTFGGGVHMLEPGAVVYRHHGLPRIEPGRSLTIRASLRFAGPDTDVEKLKADFINAFRDYHRPRMAWKDRRPIGAIFIGSGRGPDNNPRNWFKDKDLDVGTEAGRAELRDKMMKHADRCIRVLKGVNAQGMVLWDPEGGENPHPVTYIGDPRMVKLVAPEVADIYPDYFKRFRDAGLSVGCCIRPTQVYLTPPDAACDGDLDSRWSVQGFPQWIEVDLEANRQVAAIEVVCLEDRAYQYKVEGRAEGAEKYRLLAGRTQNETPGSAESPIRDSFEPSGVRRMRLTVTGAGDYDGKWISIREFRVLSPGGENLAAGKVSESSRPLGRTVGGHGTGSHNPRRNPLGDNFDDIRPKGVPWWRFFPVVERMSRKIEYARKRWGCTIFYVDTNGIHRPVGEEQKFKWTLLDNHIWRELHRRHPDVLLIPEFAPNPGQLAYTTTYLQPPYSPPILRESWRKLLPGAFGVSYTVNLGKEKWNGIRPSLLKGIEAGDVMFFRGWFGDRYNKMIKALYDEVYEEGAINPGLPESY
ncbi:MAG: discoidin domain-containing protein [Kiritimatiellia bacterium]